MEFMNNSWKTLDYTVKNLLHIINLSWKAGVLPKQATIIIPYRKPNKDSAKWEALGLLLSSAIPAN